jgi:hypothetical protein
VVARQPDDEATVRQVRTHLHGIRDRILDGDSLAPAQGHIVVGYRDVPGGGELTFHARDATARLVQRASLCRGSQRRRRASAWPRTI